MDMNQEQNVINYIKFSKKGFVGELIIDRESAFNALNSDVLDQLSIVLDEIKNEELRALIITGAGEKAFVAGADISEMWNLNKTEAEAFCRKGNSVMDKIEKLPFPTIAAINGYALGGGCELALSCDIRIASEGSVFGFPEVSLGIPPGYGGLQRISRLIGLGNAKALVFTAEKIRSEKALALGIVNSIYEKSILMDEARKLAEKISKNAPIAVRESKKVINASVGMTLDEASCLEAESFANCFETQDQYNAMGVFLKKLEPTPFQGK